MSIPRTIESGETGEVVVEFRPPAQAGTRNPRFEIVIDRPPGILTLSATAEVVLAHECVPVGSFHAALGLGEAGEQRFQVKCRQRGGNGRVLPERLVTDGSVRAEFAEEPAETRQLGSITERSRGIVVSLPPSDRPGHRSSTMRLEWADGTHEEILIRWSVEPSLQVSPSAFVRRSSDLEKTRAVIISSRDEPFRILEVRGARLDGLNAPEKSSRRHVARVSFTSSSEPGDRVSEVQIVTDHPRQPIVTLSVVELSSEADHDPGLSEPPRVHPD